MCLFYSTAAEGHVDCVKFLIEKQADVNIADRWRGVPLDDACINERVEVAIGFSLVVHCFRWFSCVVARLTTARLVALQQQWYMWDVHIIC